MFDVCCFATILEWILFDDPLVDLARADLGACLIMILKDLVRDARFLDLYNFCMSEMRCLPECTS
jgi:hypothetical protein